MALYSNQLSLSSENLVAKKKPKKRSLLRIIWTIVRIVLLAIVIAVIAQLTWSFIIFSGVFNNALFKIYSGNGGYFYKFEKEYNRVWKNDRERLERLKVFEENCRKIEELNEEAVERGKNVTYGINSMTDMTDQEFKKMLLPLDANKQLHREGSFIRKMTPIERNNIKTEHTSHFDWRQKGVVTPVKAQGKCGSCWAFASVATTESAYAVAHGVLRSLSEQELLDCNLENFACNGGNVERAFR